MRRWFAASAFAVLAVAAGASARAEQAAPKTVEIVVDVAERGGNVVSADPAAGPRIRCGNDPVTGRAGFFRTCKATIAAGSQVALAARPAPNSSFLGWSSDEPGCSGDSCTFTATRDAKVAARFRFNGQMAKLTVLYDETQATTHTLSTIPATSVDCSTNPLQGAAPSARQTCTLWLPVGTLVALVGKKIDKASKTEIDFVGPAWPAADCTAVVEAVHACNVAVTGDKTVRMLD